MPSTKKTLHFISCALLTAVAVGLLGYGMSAQWAVITMECAGAGTNFYNGSAEIALGLFNGELTRTFCPVFGDDESFQVIPQLMKADATVPAVLQGLVVCFVVLCLLFSAGSILISLYNSVSNPYETYMGPSGVYAFSSLSACVALVAVIIFALNVALTSMAETLVDSLSQNFSLDLRNKRMMGDVGLYLIIPYIILSVSAIGCIYSYQRAAYTHKRQQQRPTDDAPKDIMMF